MMVLNCLNQNQEDLGKLSAVSFGLKVYESMGPEVIGGKVGLIPGYIECLRGNVSVCLSGQRWESLYGCESWALNAKEWKKKGGGGVDMLDMQGQRTQKDNIRCDG